MLTDIFAERYRDKIIFETFSASETRLLNQSYRILSEQLIPFTEKDSPNKRIWSDSYSKLSMELGPEELSPHYFNYPTPLSATSKFNTVKLATTTVCKNFICSKFDNSNADVFVKERLSFIELAFRAKEKHLQSLSREYKESPGPTRGNYIGTFDDRKARHEKALEKEFATFQANVDELNTRFRQAGAALNYHNGFIQIAEDSLSEKELETPFWSVVSDPKWQNVDTDMKEALDLRDSDGRDPAFYAAKALESTIKIISDDKEWSTGNEKGAAHYINNLVSKTNGRFIDTWEMELLILFFSKVRNPFGHGTGSCEMPSLSSQQTQWAIESSMSWIKSLIKRS